MRHSILTSFDDAKAITAERLNALVLELNDAINGVNRDVSAAVHSVGISAGAAATPIIMSTSLYAIFTEREATTIAAGASAAAAWQYRDINTTEINAATGFIARSGNLITLQPGTYLITASAPASMVGHHQLRIADPDDDSTLLLGSSEWCGAINTRAVVEGVLTVAVATDIKVSHYTETAVAVTGLGTAASTGEGEVYAILKIFKL